jgi:hypothetical protein
MLSVTFDRAWARRAWKGALTIGATVVIAALAGFSAPASAQLIMNGNFETTPSGTTTSYQVSGSGSTALPGWTLNSTPNSSGINCLIYNTGPTYTMCGPGYASPTQSSNVTFAVFPGYSPAGGNFLGADSSPSYNRSISQSVSGLVVGQQYSLSFYQAGAQQQGYVGATTDMWQVTFGSSTKNSTVMSVPQQGDAAWNSQSMIFTATSTSQLLTFLAIGTPSNANPPFALLDGVSLIQVPEPASIALMGFGVAGIAGLRRRRARRTVAA